MDYYRYNQELAEHIRLLRIKKNIAQDTIAKALNIKQCSYSRIENGKRLITVVQLKIIAAELHTNMIDILKSFD